MQEKVNNKVVVKDSFVDFEGKTHNFIIAAVKTSLKNKYDDIPEVIQSIGNMKISSVEVISSKYVENTSSIKDSIES